MTLDRWRDGVLRRHGFVDAFIDLKDRENGKMLPLLAAVCRELDSLRGAEQLRAAVEGVFAGNIFDMGAEETAKKFLSHSPDFFNTRADLPRRPWLVDDYDSLERSLLHKIYRTCVFFVDNAGSDFLLGALPMIRWLAQRGTRVVIAANERPSLNDMAIEDVRNWWPRILEAEPSFGTYPIELVSTGTGEPLIDLAEVSRELNEAAHDADLIILEGMGRGVMSNFDAAFTCDALNIAMIKDDWVARRLGGKIFDLVCRFR
jgi:type II pantothenate kinase